MLYVLSDCGSCGAFHPVVFEGDCRDNQNRFYTVKDYAHTLGVEEDKINILSQEEIERLLDSAENECFS